MVCGHDNASVPLIDIFGCKEGGDSEGEGISAGLDQTHQQQSGVRAGRKPPHVREIQILGDKKTPARLSCLPDLVVVSSGQVFRRTVSTSCPSEWSSGTNRPGRFSSSLIFNVG